MFYRRVLAISLLVAGVLSPAALAQEANKSAKKLGKRGLYGSSSLDALDEAQQKAPPTEAERKAAEEKQKKLKAKYPLSRTSYSAANQRASQLLYKGIRQYEEVRKRFDAVKDIKGTYQKESGLLKIEQKNIIPERIQPQDLLKYGPKYAHIGIRIRALQSIDKLAGSSLANFTQAQALAPSVAVIPRWIRILKDTRQAIKFHYRYYAMAVKASELGYTQEQLEMLALQWSNMDGRKLGPDAQLTTRLFAKAFEKPKASDEEGKEKANFETLIDKLPNLDFEVKNF